MNRGWFRKTALWLGFAFLYFPILSMVVFSFNNSRLVSVWDAEGSPTVKWYGLLLHDSQYLSAAWLSIKVAAMSATGAMVLGTVAGLVLARFGPFRGRALLSSMTTAPLVMPATDVHASIAALTHTGTGTVRTWPPFPIRSAITQWSSRCCTGRGARTAPSRASSRWPGCGTSAPACSPRR